MRVASLILCLCVIVLTACSSHISKQVQNTYSDNSETPFRIYFSARTSTIKDDIQNSHRITGILWGNTSSHVRVDLSAGIGVLIARALETDSTFAIHIPQEKKLYVYPSARDGMGAMLGVKIPFTLQELTQLALCQSSGISAQNFNKDGWKTSVAYKEDRPFRLSAQYTDGTSVVITLKKIEYTESFASSQMQLAPPEGTSVICRP